jgi:hypothetical protein
MSNVNTMSQSPFKDRVRGRVNNAAVVAISTHGVNGAAVIQCNPHHPCPKLWTSPLAR